MSDIQPDPSVIGGIAAPPFARLPDPGTMFVRRAERFRAVAIASELAPFLLFLANIADAQHAIQPALPPAALSGTVSAPAPEVIPPKPSETVAALQKMREKDPAFIARKRVLDSRVAQGDAVVGDRRPLPEHLCGHLHQWRGDR